MLKVTKKIKDRYFDPEKDALFLLRSVVDQKPKNMVQTFIRMLRKKRLVKKYGIFIGSKAQIGKGLRLPHPHGIVIGKDVRIGDNVIIYQNVTIGAARRGEESKELYPTIGNGCCIFAGSVIAGKIDVGENVTIGANSVLLTDAESNSVYAGVPAKRIDKR